MIPLLEIAGLRVEVEGREILRGLDLVIPAGETHAIMGPNGSGKSTLAYAIAGREGYEITAGALRFQGEDISDWEPEQRARAGIFLAFQYPVEIPGVNNTYFLKAAVNEVRKHRGEPEMDAVDFLALMRRWVTDLDFDPALIRRPVNAGFSGGEKKRNEILQMSVLEPTFAVLDETDSGLDIDALRIVADGVNRMRSPDRGFLVITHYQRLLNHLVPDRVHVLRRGRIVESGGGELALRLEAEGYGRAPAPVGV